MSALGYWTLATEFLGLVEAAGTELIDSGNPWVVVGDPATVDDYSEITKWSDHAIGVPLIFNFLHGVELILKGFLALKGAVPPHHRLSDLLRDFDENFGESSLHEKVEQAIDPADGTPLRQFLEVNGISIDSWYQALKYPESTQGMEFVHVDLKYGALNTLEFWTSIRDLAHEIRAEAVRLARKLGEV